jgi:uncharacterized short protein YbdD (DUF466 family)
MYIPGIAKPRKHHLPTPPKTRVVFIKLYLSNMKTKHWNPPNMTNMKLLQAQFD